MTFFAKNEKLIENTCAHAQKLQFTLSASLKELI